MQTNWKLEDIYNSTDDQSLLKDKSSVDSLVSIFRSSFKDKLSTNNLLESILKYEQIIEIIEKISSYSFLYLQTRLDDNNALSFYQSISEWLSGIESQIVFFPIEISNLDYKSAIGNSGIYKSWVENCFKYKDHLLTNDAEEALSQKSITSNRSWIRLYDEILTRLEFEYEGEIKGLPEILEIANHSKSGDERAKASKIIASRLKDESFYIKHIYNNIILDRSVENRLRRYEKPESFRHLDNNIDSKSVDFLTDSVSEGYIKTSHKYYEIKAKLLGKEKLEYWDRNAPINLSSILNKEFDYQKGCDLVLETFGSFSDVFKDIAGDFINKSWIDVYPGKSKTSGAFSHSCSCKVHPYILLNYFGSLRDVSTLAHELGHGIHQTLSSKNGAILSETPITLSEVASLFAEKMLFEKMFEKTENDLEKIDLLCSKLDDTINSIMRQIAFFKFERRAHEMRLKQELSIEDLNQIFLETQRECLGKHVNVDDSVGYFWTYISHFFHAPFYVYAYAFGEIFTNALYGEFKKSGPDFVLKYIEMLSKGGIDRYDTAASKFGLEPKSKEFWKNGVELIAKQISDLENLCGHCSVCS